MVISRPPILAKPSPSVRNSNDSFAISWEGNCAIITEISSTRVQSRQRCSKAPTSKRPLPDPPPLAGEGRVGVKNVSRLALARLQAVSSKNIYSEHGLDARISPDALQVCQSFMVVLKCRPGSALAQAA